MHIAVCDDNIADRKQTERLLARESDARINTSGNLYVDSFGNASALTTAPMKYDLFLLDMTAEKPDGAEIAKTLRNMGVTAPIILLISSANYREYTDLPEHILFLDKPIKKAELSELLDKVIAAYDKKPPTIELRDASSAYYVLPDQFVYAAPENGGMHVVLTDTEDVIVQNSLEELCITLGRFNCFYILNKKYVINLDHVVRIEKRNVILSDDTELPLGIGEKKSLLRHLSSFGKRFLPENLTD